MRLDNRCRCPAAGAEKPRTASKFIGSRPGAGSTRDRGRPNDALAPRRMRVQAVMPPTPRGATPLSCAEARCPLDGALRRRPTEIVLTSRPGWNRAPSPGNPRRALGERRELHQLSNRPCRGSGGERRPGIVHRSTKDNKPLHSWCRKSQEALVKLAGARSRSGSLLGLNWP